jgi:predicted acylesterase/phospholipase RssA
MSFEQFPFHERFQALTSAGTSRFGAAFGAHGALALRVIDVIFALSTFGVLGGLPPLLKIVGKYARRAMPWRHGSEFQRQRGLLILVAASLFSLQGCTRIIRPDSTLSIQSGAPTMIRTLGTDQRFSNLSTHSVAQRVHTLRGGDTLNILAMSGGGANGAFGAGALVGLTRSGSRPQFTVVTGVSAGALIAPYAFLGSAWDPELVEIYTTGQAEHLLQSRGLGALFGSSIYRGTPLKDLVDHYTTDALIQAVAREAAAGRLLLIVTTDVETAEPVVWDLGSIAMNGGPNARTLFRDVLVASASVPGMLPPVIIRVQEERTITEEAHLDGTISVPFYVPTWIAEKSAEGGIDQAQGPIVYVIVDGRLSEEPASVPMRTKAILSRSVSAGLNHMMRTTLQLTATNAELHGEQLQYSAIPVSYPVAATFDFRADKMRPLFGYGYSCAQAGRLWVSSGRAIPSASPNPIGVSQRIPIPCPVDDDSEFVAALRTR